MLFFQSQTHQEKLDFPLSAIEEIKQIKSAALATDISINVRLKQVEQYNQRLSEIKIAIRVAGKGQ